ncbi:hypothetical protein JNW90_30830 [Micromonospora sp. STR1s_5]|nr:hypothetical protein [Micromonospora sp. STR1s_5]
MTTKAANKGQFKPGQSGNPSGRTPGARSRTTRALDELLDSEADAITRKAIELAKGGDGPALRLVLDRIVPPRRDRHIAFPLPPIQTAADAVPASAAVLKAVAEGELTFEEAEKLTKMVANVCAAIEVADLAERLTRLEAEAAKR